MQNEQRAADSAEYLTQDDICKLAQFSKRTFHRIEARGQGPRKTYITDDLIRYSRDDVNQWFASSAR
jgi:predicted DNA-binding transcriptional regulator AlpA